MSMKHADQGPETDSAMEKPCRQSLCTRDDNGRATGLWKKCSVDLLLHKNKTAGPNGDASDLVSSGLKKEGKLGLAGERRWEGAQATS